MNTTRLLIAAAVLAALGGVLWWSNKTEAAKAGAVDPKAPPKLLELKTDDIAKIEIQHRGEPATVLAKNDSGKWNITAPQNLAADESGVTGITSAANSLASDRVVDENPTDLASYGLDPPVLSVTFSLKDGSTKRLRIGESTPDNSGNYAAVDGDKRLFTMGSFNKNSFDKRVNDLRDKHLLRFEPEKLSRVELNVPGKASIELGRTGSNEWQIVRPRPMRADGFQVDELVRNLRDAQMDANADAKQAASAFGSGRLVATAKVVSPDGEGTFEVRESKGEYYARSNMVEGVFKIAMDTGTGLNKSLDDLRSKKIFDFSFDDPSKIEFNDNGKLQIFEKSGENWTSGGKTMDSISVQNLIDKLRDLGIAGYEAPAVTQAEITITVVSKNGSRTETVEMQAKGTDWSARRMGSNETYRVTGTDITSLRQAVSGVREPPPPDKAGKDNKGDNK